MHRLLLLPADDRIDVHLGYVRAVNRQRAPVIIDDKSRVLSHDIDAQVRRGEEVVVRLVAATEVSRAPMGKVEVRVLVAARALPPDELQEEEWNQQREQRHDSPSHSAGASPSRALRRTHPVLGAIRRRTKPENWARDWRSQRPRRLAYTNDSHHFV